LDENDPNCIKPLKRPRLTPNPTLALKDGKPHMAIGTPGNDRQPQAMLQVLLNMTLFDMEPQEAAEMPRFASYGFPASTHPHASSPNLLQIEADYPKQIIDGLIEKGHDIKQWPSRHWSAGGVCIVRFNDQQKTFESAADFRRDGYAVGI
jgi:gamma-glutamyltranspeptidase/glutathione hydrolase